MNEKALKVIESAKSQLGNPYVFGMWGRECTPSVRRQYAGYNPSHKSAIFKACPRAERQASILRWLQVAGEAGFRLSGLYILVLVAGRYHNQGRRRDVAV